MYIFRHLKKIISLFFVSLLCLPSILGLNHVIHGDHSICHEQQIHFHEYEIDCSTCDFIRISFDYNSNEFEYSKTNYSFFHENITVQTGILTSFYFNSFYLRGPPSNYIFS